MSELAQVLGAHGAPHEIDFEGKTYKVRHIDEYVLDAFQKKQLAKRKNALREMRGLMTDQQFDDRLREMTDDYSAGKYSVLGEFGQEGIKTPAGIMDLCSLIFDDIDHMALVRLLLGRREEIVSLISLIIRESLPQAKTSPDAQVTKPVPTKPALVA